MQGKSLAFFLYSLLLILVATSADPLLEDPVLPDLFGLEGQILMAMKPHFDYLRANAERYCPGGRLAMPEIGRSCLEGHVYPQQAGFYFRLGTNPNVKTVCEIGFNAGHSAAIWLTANPEAHLISFDLFNKPYSQTAYEYIDRTFPGRFFLVSGDSTETVPHILSTQQVTCDIVHVDGGHDDDVPRKDILNFIPATHCATTLVLDDVPGSDDVRKAWADLVDEQLIQEFACARHFVYQSYASRHRLPRGWCTGAYLHRPCLRTHSNMARDMVVETDAFLARFDPTPLDLVGAVPDGEL